MPTSPPASDARRALYAAILGAGMVMGLALGIRHVQGLFMLPMTLEHGWSRETFSLALAIQNLVFGLAQPWTGMLADRLGGARVLAAGAVLYGIGLAAMAFADTPAALVLSCGVVTGVALSCTAPLTNALVSQLFGVQYIGTLFGLVFLGHQLGAFLGVWLGGHVFEATRSCDLVWLAAIALGLIAAGLHWPIDDRPVTLTTAARAT